MNPLRAICLMAGLLAIASASSNSNAFRKSGNSLNNRLKPSEWLPANELERLPALDELSFEELLKQTPDEGAELINKIYHTFRVSQIQPDYVPNANDIPVYIAQPKGQKIQVPLTQVVDTIKQQLPRFGNEEVTILITGASKELMPVKKANEKLVKAFEERYFGQTEQRKQQRRQNQQSQLNKNYDDAISDEDYSQLQQQKNDQQESGNLIVIDLGEKLKKVEDVAMLNIEKSGSIIARMLVQLTNTVDVPQDVINVIGQGISAQVAGVVGREFTRLTGHKLRRITGLDPWKVYARNAATLTGLARGDADFVDVIHTTSYGLGTAARLGKADFYPNGPAVTVPGADNIIEASMRATRYYAESVRPGNERNFPAVAASSLEQYQTQNGYGKRVYMGIDADFDIEGDYILQVNSGTPFGQSAPARKQNTYHAAHQPWRSASMDY